MPLTVAIIIGAVLVIASAAIAVIVFSSFRAEKVEQRNKELALAASTGKRELRDQEPSRVEKALLEAGLDLPSTLFVGAVCALAVMLALLGWFIGGIVVAVIFGIAAFACTWFWLAGRRRARKGAFEEQLCEALPMIAEGIRSGMTFERAAQNAANFMNDPLAGQFKRMALERSYGMSLTEAVENIAKRTGSRDMNEIAAVVAINAQTGGNMAGIIDSVAHNMQSRARLRRHVKSVTASGRMQKNIITVVPIVVVVALLALAREYVITLFTTLPGIIMTAVSVAMIVAGNLIMKKLYEIKIY